MKIIFCSCFLFLACDPSVDLDFQNLVGAPDFDEQDVSRVKILNFMGRMIETSLKLTKSTIRLSLVRLCLSLDFSWYDRKQVLQDLSLVKHTSILCLSILDKCPNALDCHLD